MGFIGNQALINGMNMSSLGKLLEREAPVVRNSQPAGLSDLFWPGKSHFAFPESGQAPPRPAWQSPRWLPVFGIALLTVGLVWLFGRTSRVEKPAVSPKSAVTEPTGSANRVANDPVEAVRLSLGKIELYFDPGSTRLRPESRDQLEVIAKTLASNLDVHTTLTGHTDDARERPRNFELATQRAVSIMTQLIRKGVPSDRLSAEGGAGNHSPEGNSGAVDRADNRRVTLEFSEH